MISSSPQCLSPLRAFDLYRSDPDLSPRKADIGTSEILTIGYGGAGGPPLAFNVPAGQSQSSGFLKVIASTEYIDITDMYQDSPFDRAPPKSVISMPPLPVAAPSWDVQTYLLTTVIPESDSQRRPILRWGEGISRYSLRAR
jgi:hypothetical protein